MMPTSPASSRPWPPTPRQPPPPVATTSPRPVFDPDRVGRIVAAIDDKPTSRSVLRVGARLGDLLDLPVHAVHVEERTNRQHVAVELAAHADTPLELTGPGDPVEVFADLAASGHDLVVLGSRGLDIGAASIGHVAMAVIRRAHAPVVLVPPDPHTDDPIDRILVPLDDDPLVTAAVRPVVAWLTTAGCRVTGLHVFDVATVPTALDHPGHGTGAWRRSFAHRHGLDDTLTARGVPEQRILRTVEEQRTDLVVLGWRQVMLERRAPVVRTLLTACRTPVLLVPMGPTSGPTDVPGESPA